MGGCVPACDRVSRVRDVTRLWRGEGVLCTPQKNAYCGRCLEREREREREREHYVHFTPSFFKTAYVSKKFVVGRKKKRE